MATLPGLSNMAPGAMWPGAVANQSISSCGIGICDGTLCNFVRGAELATYDTVLVQATISAGGDPIVLVAGVEYDFFSTGGVGQPIVGGWGQNKGLEYTDGLFGGAPVDQGYMMIACGAAIRTMPCFQQGDDGAGAQSATSPQWYADWLGVQDDGPCYGQRLEILVLNLTSLRLKLGDTGGTYYLGCSSIFASFIGPRAGGHAVSNGNITRALSYTPFMACVGLGAANDLNRAIIQMFVGQNAQIESNATIPTAGPPVGETIGVATLYVPVQLFLFGYTVCFDTAACCGQLTFDEAIALRAWAQSNGVLSPNSNPSAPAAIGLPSPIRG